MILNANAMICLVLSLLYYLLQGGNEKNDFMG